MQVLMDAWTPYGPSLHCIIFDREVGYGFLVASIIDAQYEMHEK